MWAPIIFNFFATILTIIGLFGNYYRRPGHLVIYGFWQVAALAFNAFVAAFYLELGHLKRESDYLNLGSGSRSWWESNGPNCEPQYNVTQESFTLYDLKPVSVDGCLLPFFAIEVFQAAVHFGLALFGLLLATCVLCIGRKDDDSCEYYQEADMVSLSLPGTYSVHSSMCTSPLV